LKYLRLETRITPYGAHAPDETRIALRFDLEPKNNLVAVRGKKVFERARPNITESVIFGLGNQSKNAHPCFIGATIDKVIEDLSAASKPLRFPLSEPPSDKPCHALRIHRADLTLEPSGQCRESRKSIAVTHQTAVSALVTSEMATMLAA
jgi:hypothetical protein